MKTNIEPIIRELENLKESDVKVLLCMFHYGEWLSAEQLEVYTGLHIRTVKISLAKPRIRNIVKKMEKKDEFEQMFLRMKAFYSTGV
jgi:hypothetical protein